MYQHKQRKKGKKDDKPKEISRQTNKETTDYQLPTPLTSRPSQPTLSPSGAGGIGWGLGEPLSQRNTEQEREHKTKNKCNRKERTF